MDILYVRRAFFVQVLHFCLCFRWKLMGPRGLLTRKTDRTTGMTAGMKRAGQMICFQAVDWLPQTQSQTT